MCRWLESKAVAQISCCTNSRLISNRDARNYKNESKRILASWSVNLFSLYYSVHGVMWFFPPTLFDSANQVGMKCHFIIYQLEINFSACYTIVFYFRKLFKSWREKWKRTFGRIKSSEDTHLPPETEICNALVFMRTGLEENSGYLMLLHGSERLNQSNYFW